MLSFCQGTKFTYLKITVKSHPLCVVLLLSIMCTAVQALRTLAIVGAVIPIHKKVEEFLQKPFVTHDHLSLHTLFLLSVMPTFNCLLL